MNRAVGKLGAVVALVATVILSPGEAGATPGALVHRYFVFRLPVSTALDIAHLSCGWHRSCTSAADYAIGYAFDFHPDFETSPATRNVYYTTSVHTPDGDTPNVASVKLAHWQNQSAGNCNEVFAETYHATGPQSATDRFLFRIVYQHTTPNWTESEFTVAGKGGNDHVVPNVIKRVGLMYEEDEEPCNPDYFTGVHVHVKLCYGSAPVARSLDPGGPNARSSTNCPTAVSGDGYPVSRPWVSSKVTPRWNDYTRQLPYADENIAPGDDCEHEEDMSGNACDATYPGPRFNELPYKVWTNNYTFSVNSLTNELAPVAPDVLYATVPYEDPLLNH